MSTNKDINQFIGQLVNVNTLTPREDRQITQAIYTRQVVTVVGVKTTTSRFLPVSHAGYSNETYVDKLDLLGKTRAEFIGRKLKGIERRAHMTLFREMAEHAQKEQKISELKDKPEEEKEVELAAFRPDWHTFFSERFGRDCTIPDGLCIACWNCSLFGGLVAGRGATFSRIRYFDTFSVEDAVECVQTDDSPEQMAIGNTVGEDLSVERGEASFHRYEYVKASTRFPFITVIESPTPLDVAGYLAAVKLADQHGYGKYSANHGKFKTEFLAVSTGYPLFSVLDMLTWLESTKIGKAQGKTGDDAESEVSATTNDQSQEENAQNETANTTLNQIRDKLKFETVIDQPVSLFGSEIKAVQQQLSHQFQAYISALNAVAQDGRGGTTRRRGRSRRG